MGVRYQRRDRNARIRPDNIYIAYAVGITNNSDKTDDIEPIIRDVGEKAEANRRRTLELLDRPSEI